MMHEPDKSLKAWEETVVSLLKIYLSKQLAPSILGQINSILERQFAPEQYWEIGGAVFYKEGNLKFRNVKCQEAEKIERALEEFERGGYDNLETLLEYARKKKEWVQEHATRKKGDIYSIWTTLYTLFESIFDKKEVFKESHANAEIALLCKKFLLGKTYLYSLEQLGFHDHDFMSIFHVHPNGSEPNMIDISVNAMHHVPNLVISAVPEYAETGIKLHLVHSGNFETLYEGTLVIKNGP